MSDPRPDSAERVLAYHRASKHHPHRYAPSPGRLDWANQPDPFRTFTGAPAVDLPLLADALPTSYADLHAPGAVRPRRADLSSVAVLLELSLGLSAWKEYRGSRWALRCNPSSGNLHPTEGYVITPPLTGLPGGVYHYDSQHHRLERRCRFTAEGEERLSRSLLPGSFLVGLSSVHWREAWKYGDRAFRYCQHDLGHAVAAVRYAAAALGWGVLLLDHVSDDDLAAWLGIDRDEDFIVDPLDREAPGAMLLVGPGPLVPLGLEPSVRDGATWSGRANALSRGHVAWKAIAPAARASRRWASVAGHTAPMPPLPDLPRGSEASAATLIRQRRSCLGLDGTTSLDAGAFFGMLDRLLPRRGVAPFDTLPWAPQVDLALFVHRVRGLEPGLYYLERAARTTEDRRQAMASRFAWQCVPGCPEHLPLSLLAPGDLRQTAERVSCHQDIAGDGALSLGMIAWFAQGVRDRGGWWYRRLFWEAGVIGQVLYLEAEAAGVRGTGIGCYFDDSMHELLGLAEGDERWQSLYHFTVGGPTEDERLRTVAPYAHLEGR